MQWKKIQNLNKGAEKNSYRINSRRVCLHETLTDCDRLFLHRGQQAGVRARPQRHAHTRRPGSPAHVPRPQPRPACPGRPARRPPHQRPTQPSSRAAAGPPPSAAGHAAPPPVQVPHHLRTLPGGQDPAVALPVTRHQRTHVPPPHEPGHGEHVLSHQRPL